MMKKESGFPIVVGISVFVVAMEALMTFATKSIDWIWVFAALVVFVAIIWGGRRLIARIRSNKTVGTAEVSAKTASVSYGIFKGIGVTTLNLVVIAAAAFTSYIWQPFDGRLSWWIFPVVMGVVAFSNKIVGGRHEDAGTLKNHRNTYEGINFFYTVLFWVSFIPAFVVHLPPIFRWMLENM